MATFPLLDEPTAETIPLPPPSDTSLPSFSEALRYGQGLVVPFTRQAASDFQTGTSAALVRSSVAQVLATRADDGVVSGELPWRPEFGSLLHRLRFMNTDDVFDALVRTRVVGAISQWEPRCRVKNVEVARVDSGRGDLVTRILVTYDLVTTSGTVLAQNQSLVVTRAG